MLAQSLIASALLFATGAQAHATFQQLWVNGVDQAGKCVRTVSTNSPISSVTTNDLTCNAGGTTPAASTCEVSAGDVLAVEMHQQPGQRDCATEAIGGNHDGPTIVYMAKVDDIATAEPWTADWFKVAENGLISTDYWGSDLMNDNCGKVNFTVPADIAPGNYLIRAEEIALHVAGSVGGAQFYASCYQIKVAGTGSATPATVKIPGAYSATDPGILFDLYSPHTSYTIPGPAVYEAGGASSPAPATSAAVSSSAAATSALPTTVATTAAPEPTVETSIVAEPTTSAEETSATETAAPEPTTVVEDPTTAVPEPTTSVAEESTAPLPTTVATTSAAEPTVDTSVVAEPTSAAETTSSAAPEEPTTVVEEPAPSSTSVDAPVPTTSAAAPVPTTSVAAPVPTTAAATTAAPAPTGGVKDANQCWREYNHCLDASQPAPDFTGCGSSRDSCLSGARYMRHRRAQRFAKARL